MMEFFSAVTFFAVVIGGGAVLESFHDVVRRAALKKAEKGMPSLVEMNRALQQKKRQ